MRVERGHHPVDRAFDQRGIARLLDIVGADPLEDLAKQVELRIGVCGARGSLGPGDQMFALRSHDQEGQAYARQRAQEKKEILPHMSSPPSRAWPVTT